MRERTMNAAVGASGAYRGGTGTVPNKNIPPNVSGTGTFNIYRYGGGDRGLNPTTGFLLGLTAVEILALVLLRRYFRSAHGG